MNFMPKSVSRTVGLTVLKAKKNSPHIFFGLGVAGVVGGTVLACRATLKASETLEEIQDDVLAVKEMATPRVADPADEFSEHDYYKHLGLVYLRGAGSMGRLYGPSVAVMGLSIASLTGSHVTLTKRNTALTATLTTVSAAYEKYREAVKEKLGVEEERDLFFNARTEAIEHSDGTKEVVKISNGARSEYAVIFDEFNPNFDKNPGYNQAFLSAQQTYWNQKLQQRGFVFLNEVYETLGFDQTTAGQIVGWLWDGDGDNYIDFGLFEPGNENFTFGWEKAVWLDFNVDGPVYDKI